MIVRINGRVVAVERKQEALARTKGDFKQWLSMMFVIALAENGGVKNDY
jgi:hypothetical protein